MSMLHDLIQADLFGGGSGGSGSQNAVLYTEQTLTDAQKEQARTNIGAGEPVDAVLYTQQSLTDAQKEQARTNIGAGEPCDGPLFVTVNKSTGAASETFASIAAALSADRGVVFVVPFSGVYAYLTTIGILEEYVIQATGVADFGNAPTLVIYTLMYNNTGAINTRAVDAVSEITLPGTTPTLTPVVYTSYECGTLESLTITNPPADGSWSVHFTSGSTATVLTMPSSVKMPDGFEVEANTEYEINVLNERALVASWPVASS